MGSRKWFGRQARRTALDVYSALRNGLFLLCQDTVLTELSRQGRGSALGPLSPSEPTAHGGGSVLLIAAEQLLGPRPHRLPLSLSDQTGWPAHVPLERQERDLI